MRAVMRVQQRAAPLLAAILVMAAGPAWAGHLNAQLLGLTTTPMAQNAAVNVIVTARPGATTDDAARAAFGVGGAVLRRLDVVNGVATQISASQLASLAHDPAVAAVEPDDVVTGSLDLATATIGANSVWQDPGLTGDGVTVAVVDSGIYDHPDLHGRIVGWKDLVNGVPTPYDDYGHGTHIAGIIASDGQASSDSTDTRHFIGVAPEANLVGVKVLDAQGSGRTSTVIAGIDWCIRNKKRYHIRVINLSLGHKPTESYTLDPLCQACETAERHGLLVVTAAGNAGRLGYQTIDSPGNDPMVLTVGSTDMMGDSNRANDRVSSYSGRGPTLFDHVLKPDILAPGNRIISLRSPGSYLDVTYPSLVFPLSGYSTSAAGESQYTTLSGTSMAAAMASGAAALLLQQDPDASPGMLKARLMVSATKWADNLRGLLSTGAGYLDVVSAVQTPAPEFGRIRRAFALSPILTPQSTPNQILINSPSSTDLVWGDNTQWGDDGGDTGAVTPNNTTWWDDASVAAYGPITLWGDTVSTGSDGSIFASNTMWGDPDFWSAPVGVLATSINWGDGVYSDPNTLGPLLSTPNAVWGNDLVFTYTVAGSLVSADNTQWGDDEPPPPTTP